MPETMPGFLMLVGSFVFFICLVSGGRIKCKLKDYEVDLGPLKGWIRVVLCLWGIGFIALSFFLYSHGSSDKFKFLQEDTPPPPHESPFDLPDADNNNL